MVRDNVAKIGVSFILSASLLMGSGLNALALTTDKTSNLSEWEKEFEIRTTNLEEDFSKYFDEAVEKDNKTYILSGMSTELIDAQEVTGACLFYTSGAVTDIAEVEEPQEMMEEDGITYYLKDAKLVSIMLGNRTKYVETDIVLNGLEWNEQIPLTSKIRVTDNVTGQEIVTTMPLIEVKADEEVWDDTFSFPIIVSGYDANQFMLGNVAISKEDYLLDYKDDFLQYLGLARQQYRITSIEWNGEEYHQDGIIQRNAVARGEKLVHNVVALYGGDASLPELEGWQYDCLYVTDDEIDNTVYTIRAIATYALPQVDSEMGILQWLVELFKLHPVIVLAIAAIFIIGFIILIVVKKKKKNQNDNDDGQVDVVDLE